MGKRHAFVLYALIGLLLGAVLFFTLLGAHAFAEIMTKRASG